MKKIELLFAFLLVPLDYLMLILAGLSAYYIRFADFTRAIRPVSFNLDIEQFLFILAPVAIGWILIFALAGLYSTKNGLQKFFQEIYKIFLSCSAGFMFIAVAVFMSRELFDSRFIVLAFFVLAIIYITVMRAFVRYVRKMLFRAGIGSHRVVLIGSSKTADILMNLFSVNKKIGYRVIKRVRGFNFDSAEEILKLVNNGEIDEIIQADPSVNSQEMMNIYDFTDEHHITFKYAADLFDAKAVKTEMTDIAGIPIVEIKKTPLDGWGRIVKRIFDIIVSGSLIILLSPVLIITALLIKITTEGPVFFSRKDDGSFCYRVGQGGRSFRYFKFRSMVKDAHKLRQDPAFLKKVENLRAGTPMMKFKDDPRITLIGRFIRRWSIDELPELFLVFRGDMSLVGPRPHLPEEVAKYERHHKKVLTIKPGITGMAQVSGRSDLSFDDEVKLDTYYIENWSLAIDIAILLKTPMAVLKIRNAD